MFCSQRDSKNSYLSKKGTKIERARKNLNPESDIETLGFVVNPASSDDFWDKFAQIY
jgi:hypothetical protein